MSPKDSALPEKESFFQTCSKWILPQSKSSNACYVVAYDVHKEMCELDICTDLAQLYRRVNWIMTFFLPLHIPRLVQIDLYLAASVFSVEVCIVNICIMRILSR